MIGNNDNMTTFRITMLYTKKNILFQNKSNDVCDNNVLLEIKKILKIGVCVWLHNNYNSSKKRKECVDITRRN